MPNAALKPGYVYVLSHPELKGWYKVGHTYRPPSQRARELSHTAWPSPLEVAHARFFWDSKEAEKKAHHILARHGRRREFFGASLRTICQVIGDLEDSLEGENKEAFPVSLENLASHPDPDAWIYDLDRREEEWEQGVLECASSENAIREKGWRRWMRLSAEGWAEGSRRLGEAMIEHHPGLQGARQASWVFDAAAKQGLPGGRLKAAWLRSWSDHADDLEAWRLALRHAGEIWGSRSWLECPEQVRQVLLLERRLVRQLPPDRQRVRIHLAQVFPSWEQVPEEGSHP